MNSRRSPRPRRSKACIARVVQASARRKPRSSRPRDVPRGRRAGRGRRSVSPGRPRRAWPPASPWKRASPPPGEVDARCETSRSPRTATADGAASTRRSAGGRLPHHRAAGHDRCRHSNTRFRACRRVSRDGPSEGTWARSRKPRHARFPSTNPCARTSLERLLQALPPQAGPAHGRPGRTHRVVTHGGRKRLVDAARNGARPSRGAIGREPPPRAEPHPTLLPSLALPGCAAGGRGRDDPGWRSSQAISRPPRALPHRAPARSQRASPRLRGALLALFRPVPCRPPRPSRGWRRAST